MILGMNDGHNSDNIESDILRRTNFKFFQWDFRNRGGECVVVQTKYWVKSTARAFSHCSAKSCHIKFILDNGNSDILAVWTSRAKLVSTEQRPPFLAKRSGPEVQGKSEAWFYWYQSVHNLSDSFNNEKMNNPEGSKYTPTERQNLKVIDLNRVSRLFSNVRLGRFQLCNWRA